MTLEEYCAVLKSEGKTSIEVLKWLRDHNMIVSFSEVRRIYAKLTLEKFG